jgi:hypothetical protein
MLGSATKKLISSANNTGIGELVTVLGKSFMYKRNNNGPHTDPCGTP